MAGTPEYPSVPSEKLTDWELVEEGTETVFKLPAARVVGATRQYEDEQMRRAVREATDGTIDHKFRFFAATKLGFDPMLPPGTLPSMILPTMQSEARKKFKRRLENRGVTDIRRARTERMRVRSGNRARLTRYDGTDPVVDGGLPVTGWVGVWNDGTDFYVVTGGYPGVPLADALGVDNGRSLDRTPNEAQTELFDLLRDVQ
jgi:hypothetical protein